MSTRSRIGLQLADDAILSVYHHWDGYPEWLGVTLNKKFNTREKIEELIDGGDMSCCDSDNTWDYNEKLEVSRPLYYSERGEDTPPKIAESFTEFLDQAENCCGEYAYLFNNGEWTCYEVDTHFFFENNGSMVKGRIVDIPSEKEAEDKMTAATY